MWDRAKLWTLSWGGEESRDLLLYPCDRGEKGNHSGVTAGSLIQLLK